MDNKTWHWWKLIVELLPLSEEEGKKAKLIKEEYYVKAVSATDAETTITKVLGEEGGLSEFKVKQLTQTKTIGVIIPDGVQIDD